MFTTRRLILSVYRRQMDRNGQSDVPAADLPPENPVDPLRDVLRKLRKSMSPGQAVFDDYGIADPLQEELDTIRQAQQSGGITAGNGEARRKTLPFGADKWGTMSSRRRSRGSETSILVGLVAALVATVLGTLLGAFAGYFGGWLDDLINWFYNVFTSIPYLLLILAVAAVLQSKGVLTIILILGLTGWTGVFPSGACRIYEAQGKGICAGRQYDRRIGLAENVRAYLSQCQSYFTGADVDSVGRIHQVRSDPELSRVRCAGRRGVMGQHAQ